tara:strand:+ start:262 stop:654 length:393 start_codon:yes stop_codon:yes gene_type:complete
MKLLTKTQVRILATIKLYSDKAKPKPPRITSKVISKELTDMHRGTITTTLNSLEHIHGMVLSVPMNDLNRAIYVSKTAPGSIRNYYITDLGNKTINRYLQMTTAYAKPSIYEKLFRTSDKTLRDTGHLIA